MLYEHDWNGFGKPMRTPFEKYIHYLGYLLQSFRKFRKQNFLGKLNTLEMIICEVQKFHIFQDLDCFSKLKICCGNSFGFRTFSRPHHTTKPCAIDFFDQEDYFSNIVCDNESSRKCSESKWIKTTYFEFWKTVQILKNMEFLNLTYDHF